LKAGGAKIFIDERDTLYIYDTGLLRIQTFDSVGKYLSAFKLDINSNISSFSVDKQGKIFLSHSILNPDENFLISVYTLKNNKYSLEKRFSKPPFKFSEKDFDFDSLPKYQILLKTNIIHNEKGELFQIFRSYPLLRKYDINGNLLWEKKLDFTKPLKHYTSPVAREHSQCPTQTEMRKDWITGNKYRRFCKGINVDYNQHRILLDSTIHAAIVTLDYDGEVTGSYFPSDVMQADLKELSNKNYYSKEVFPRWKFYYDNIGRRGLLLNGIDHQIAQTELK
ncbi:MAG: hypothetical protein JW737_02715, partial [Acidobacteria bacterium]|nr:hypothetical protein [Acidobacteriota bacterium]